MPFDERATQKASSKQPRLSGVSGTHRAVGSGGGEIAPLLDDHRASIFSLQPDNPLVHNVCGQLGTAPAQHEELTSENGERQIRALMAVRDRDVYVIESLHRDESLTVHDKLVRLLFFLGALRDAGAARITCVAPYLCYSTKHRRIAPQGPVATRYLARLFEAVQLDRLVTMDVHNPAAFENAFRIATEHLTAIPTFAEHFAPLIGRREAAVVAPDATSVERCEAFRTALEQRLNRPVAAAFIEKLRYDGTATGGNVVGNVHGRVVILVDDMICSGQTLARAAHACWAQGALEAHGAATHGSFTKETGRLLLHSGIATVAILDTIPSRSLDAELQKRLHILSCASVLASAIRRLHTGEATNDFAAWPLSHRC